MKEISVSGLDALRARTVIDVREPFEFASGHVPGAVNVPLATITDQLARIASGAPTYIICESGGRSAQATQFLAAQSIDAVNVVGGTSAWRAARLPLSTEKD